VQVSLVPSTNTAKEAMNLKLMLTLGSQQSEVAILDLFGEIEARHCQSKVGNQVRFRVAQSVDHRFCFQLVSGSRYFIFCCSVSPT
jgi:hypothetical protein